MSDASTYLRDAIVDEFLRAPATPYLALFDGPLPADELAVSGYARQPLTMGAPTDGLTTNSDDALFGPLGSSGTVTHAAILDAVSGGNYLTQIVPLADAVAWTAGQYIPVDVGDLTVLVQ